MRSLLGRSAGPGCAARICRRRASGARLFTVALLSLAGPAKSPADQPSVPRLPFRMTLNVPIPMRDGVTLSSTVFRPVANGAYPVLFVVTPYTADRWQSWGGFFASNGYIFVSVDARGRGRSSGSFEPWIHEGTDGVDVIRYLSRRIPGSDGRVAAWGGSYSGKNQWAFATSHEPALKAIAPAATGYPGYDLGMLGNVPMPSMMRWLNYVSGPGVYANLNRDDAFWTGAYSELSRGAVRYRDFDRFVGNPTTVWQDWVAHPDFDNFWLRGTPSAEQLKSITVPVLAVTGTYDDAQLGTLRYWRQYQGGSKPRPNGYLVIGPWDHPGSREPRLSLGGLTFAEPSQIDMRRLNLQWYDWILKGKARPEALKDHFNYYVAGAERWESAPTLESATKRRETLFLSSPESPASSLARRGSLSLRPPAEDEDSYVDDPAAGPFNEGPEGGSAMAPDFLTRDPIGARLRGDGLVYETNPFARAADIVGEPSARLVLAIDTPDADIRVQLFEVRADGRVIFLSQDQIRARYRKNPSRAEVVTRREEIYRFDRFPFVARTVERGSRIRLVVAPLGTSIYQQRNRNSGKMVADETPADNRVATVRLKLGAGLSRISLPYGRSSATAFWAN